ncbi:PQQ-binding-like beta-propeller repeat protein [Actinoplanes sp. NPDC051470]|uniref:outer membrane protein assembly factor BamB family protein n=1 Tax=unclassified Actinoplanes TaxID=2626549 RepID=UPI0034130EB9
MRLRNSLVAACVLAALAAAAPAQAAGPDLWTQDGYGPGRTGYNPSESVINTGTIATLEQRWTVKASLLPEGCEPKPQPPLVQNGKMFLLDNGTVSGYDNTTGKRLWNAGPAYLDANHIAVAGGLVLATEVNCFSNSNYDTNVVAINPNTGKMVWDALQGYSITSSVADAGVFVVSGFCGICDGEKYGVTAFRISDGKRLWQRINYVLAGPVSANGRIVLRDMVVPQVQVADIKTGGGLAGGGVWNVAAANPAGDQFYLYNTSAMGAFDAKTLKAAWTVKKESGALVSDGKRVFVASANRVNAYNAATGKLYWTRAMPNPNNLIRAGGLLYVLSGKKLQILSPPTGKPVVSGAAYGMLTDNVIATGGRLYTTSGSTVRAYTP